MVPVRIGDDLTIHFDTVEEARGVIGLSGALKEREGAYLAEIIERARRCVAAEKAAVRLQQTIATLRQNEAALRRINTALRSEVARLRDRAQGVSMSGEQTIDHLEALENPWKP